MNPLIIALLSAAVVVVALLWVIAGALRDIRRQLKRRRSVLRRTITRPIFSPVPTAHLEKQLLSMLGGDRQIAGRLLQSTHDRNPGRSVEWIYEKVISDLERDRRA